MSQLWAFVALLAIHWVADFLCQSHWMSVNKSKDLNALGWHIFAYTAVLGIGALSLFGWRRDADYFVWTPALWYFIAVNGALHGATDFVSSRVTRILWDRKRIHDFFVVIGLDQLIHQSTLALTMWWLL